MTEDNDNDEEDNEEESNEEDGDDYAGFKNLSLTNGNLQSNCGNTHPSVGQTLTFINQSFHNIGGTATIVDDCTIRFDDFTFDGTGIVVTVYTGQNGNFSSGQSISKDLRGPAFTGDSTILTLPVGISLNDFNSLSIWCGPAGVSFGDGQFGL